MNRTIWRRQRGLARKPWGEARAFTLIELLIVVAIIAILAGIAAVNYQYAKSRANVVSTQSNLRTVRTAMEVYNLDYNTYPRPVITIPDDPYGVVARSALGGLTTPIAYLSSGAAFDDPFGSARLQGSIPNVQGPGPLPGAQTFNPTHSVLYFNYRSVAPAIGQQQMSVNGYALVSFGPDRADSFGIYYPFGLPPWAASYGFDSIHDTLYDPTNGTLSGGDLPVFGGETPQPHDPLGI